ncbi:MAG: TIGR03668 family PPOX class F420-dependent oxidoreductase [Chloroflexaceae bacterium]|nr:TIGR03668 family PPOX class F420-dependent oxidoreductase [Chloroflexaceae bacterium]
MGTSMTLESAHYAFALAQRVGRLATVDDAMQPHALPVCYACDGAAFFIALDSKPKRIAPQQLKRVRNILANPRVALVIDRYCDDWQHLGFLLIQAQARLLYPDERQHPQAIALLRERYRPYRDMPIETQPVIMLQPMKVIAWGNLAYDASTDAESSAGSPR